MSAYTSQLNREMAQAAKPDHRKTLGQKLIVWHGTLPAVSRNRPFSMVEIEAALKAQGRQIGAELLRMGWQRKRVWSTRGSYHRYWTPPQ
jgi:hypothetical protein